MDYIDMALNAWREGEPLRTRRRRYKDYTFGRQWSDKTTDPSGRVYTEREAALATGFRPHTNNLIRQLVKCVVGNFRNSLTDTDPAREAAAIDDDTATRNSLTELDCRMLEEFLISGCAVQRVVTENRPEGCGVWIDNVSPGDFFVNRFTDTRGLDIELVGMLHSMSLRETLMRFAPTDSSRRGHLSEKYASYSTMSPMGHIGDNVSHTFFEAGKGRCRVIELWTLESRSIVRCHDMASGHYFEAPASRRAELDREVRRRKDHSEKPLELREGITLRWHCRFLAPGVKYYRNTTRHTPTASIRLW